jgi:hypothetical protein
MKIFFRGNYNEPPRLIMRRCGYGEKITRVGQVSYVRTLRGGVEFPRFHAYLDPSDDGFRVNLHLDQKSACYTGTSAHSGEYDGDIVEDEGARIRSIVESGRELGGFAPLKRIDRSTKSDNSSTDLPPPPPMRFG